MIEVLNLIYEVLLIPIPLPLTVFGYYMYFNFFGLIIVFFLIFLVSLIIRKLTGGAGDWVKL